MIGIFKFLSVLGFLGFVLFFITSVLRLRDHFCWTQKNEVSEIGFGLVLYKASECLACCALSPQRYCTVCLWGFEPHPGELVLVLLWRQFGLNLGLLLELLPPWPYF